MREDLCYVLVLICSIYKDNEEGIIVKSKEIDNSTYFPWHTKYVFPREKNLNKFSIWDFVPKGPWGEPEKQ